MKIKNENDLLGFLIKLKDKNNKVRNHILLQQSQMDSVSLEHLMKGLIENHYVIYSMDTTTITKLGENNYISPLKKFFSCIRNIALYLLGVITPYVVEVVITFVKTLLETP